MSIESDADVRERFSELREHDGAGAPTFESVIRRRSARALNGRPGRPWIAGGFAVAMAIGFLVIMRPPPEVPDAASYTSTIALPAWPTHTDFLLADASASSRRLYWSPSPTSALGRSTFSHIPEVR